MKRCCMFSLLCFFVHGSQEDVKACSESGFVQHEHTSWLQTGTQLDTRSARDNKVPCTSRSLPALDAYDVTSFFDEKVMADSAGPVRGSKEWSVSANGNDFYFASEDNKKRFEIDPQAFLPQFGGFCAWSVAAEDSQVDWSTCRISWPVSDLSAKRTSQIIDGRLYLFLNELARAAFLKQTEDYAETISAILAEKPFLVFETNLTTSELVKKGDANWARAIELDTCTGVSANTFVRDCFGTLCNCNLE